MKDFLTDEEMMQMEGTGQVSTPDFIPDEQAATYFSGGMPRSTVYSSSGEGPATAALGSVANVQPASNPYGAVFRNNPDDSPLSAGLKAAGNLPTSAYGFAKNVASTLINPLGALQSAGSIGLGGLSKAIPGIEDRPKEEQFEAFVQGLKERYGSIENLQRTAVEDPFGLGSELVGGLAGLSRTATRVGLTQPGTFSRAVTSTAAPVIAATERGANWGKNLVTTPTRFTVSQATGLNPETISRIIDDPESFTREAQATISRRGIAEEVQAALQERSGALDDTGQLYAPVRQTAEPIRVDPNFLETAYREKAGVDVIDGVVTPTSRSSVRSPSDIRALQTHYNFWKPIFERGQMLPDEFLNHRADLTDLSKFDRQVGKSKPVERVAMGVREAFNTTYRSQVKGLEDLDADFSSQKAEFDYLSKGFIDRDGNLTDAAINRIANSTGRGKDLLIDRLEEISPGITEKVKTLKAIEDIEAAMGNKVGTYTRAGGFAAGALTLNPYLIMGSILAIPQIAVPILRGVGMGADKVKSTLDLLGVPAQAINQLPNTLDKPIGEVFNSAKGVKTSLGLSIERVGEPSTGTGSLSGSKAAPTSTSRKPIGKEDVSAPSRGTSAPFEGETVYHGTSYFNAKDIKEKGFRQQTDVASSPNGQYLGKGLYLTNNKPYAQHFADKLTRSSDFGGDVVEATLPPEAKIFHVKNVEEFRKDPDFLDENGRIDPQRISDKYSKLGYDGIKADGVDSGTYEIVIFNPSKLKPSSPSIPKELEPLAAEARKYGSAEEFRNNYEGGALVDTTRLNDWITSGPGAETTVSNLLTNFGKQQTKDLGLPDLPVRIVEDDEAVGFTARFNWDTDTGLKDAYIEVTISPFDTEGNLTYTREIEADMLHELTHARQIMLGKGERDVPVQEAGADKSAAFRFNKSITDFYNKATSGTKK